MVAARSSAARVGEHRAVVWNRVYLQPAGSEPFGRRRLARTAECARRPEADVVEQDDQNIRRAGRRTQRRDGRILRVGVSRSYVVTATGGRSGIGRTSRGTRSP